MKDKRKRVTAHGGQMANSRKQSTNRHLPAGARRRQSGAAAVEFAIVFPLLFALMYATIVYGYIFFLQQTINMIAQEGAKTAVAVASYDSSGNPITAADYSVAVTNAVTNYFIDAKASGLISALPAAQRADITVTAVPTTGNPGVVTVTVFFEHLQTMFPQITFPGAGIMGLSGGIPPIPSQLTASASVRVS